MKDWGDSLASFPAAINYSWVNTWHHILLPIRSLMEWFCACLVLQKDSETSPDKQTFSFPHHISQPFCEHAMDLLPKYAAVSCQKSAGKSSTQSTTTAQAIISAMNHCLCLKHTALPAHSCTSCHVAISNKIFMWRHSCKLFKKHISFPSLDPLLLWFACKCLLDLQRANLSAGVC